MVVVYAKYRSVERIRVGYLILSDLTPKNKLYRSIYMRFSKYYQLYIPEHGDFNALI
jgi:hypothetical protein